MTTEQGWQSKETASHYGRIADVVIPNRQEILSIIASVAAMSSSEAPKILDLGCGYGDVTAEVLKHMPLASVCMVDFSEEMIQRSRERFQDNKNILILHQDLNQGLPDQLQPQEFEVVVSCFALHHVEFDRRIPLYLQICQVLKNNGVFINGDRFREHSPLLHTWVFDTWVNWMQHQIHEKLGREKTFAEVKNHQMALDDQLGDKPGTIWDMQQDLKQAGFTYVDCLFKAYQLGILVAASQ